MRPIGDIRRLVVESFRTSSNERMTYRDVMQAVVPQGVAAAAARKTVKNMAYHGALERVGELRVADSPRPLALYRLADERPAPDPHAALWQAVNSWAEFV